MMENKGAQPEPYMVFDPPEKPTQKTEIEGLSFDFNNGLRVSVPKGDYRVKFIDRTHHLTVYDAKASGVMAMSSKRYFVNFRLEVWKEPSDTDKNKKKKDEKSNKMPLGLTSTLLSAYRNEENKKDKN